MQVVESVFHEQLQAVLTPIAVHDPARFPLLFGRTVNVAVQLQGRGTTNPGGSLSFRSAATICGTSRCPQPPVLNSS
jgi:polyphosphate kinase